jgi:hypothetical protein
MLRNMYGPTKAQNGWTIRTKDELHVMYRKPNVVTTVKVRRLEWAGRLVRTCDHETAKKVFMEKPERRRKAERPKLRWLFCIEK